MPKVTWLDPLHPVFPPTCRALEEPDGLLAAGGNLSFSTLMDAYSRGIFPWYSEDKPPLWWAPAKRAVLLPGDLRLNRTTRKLIRKHRYRYTSNHCFAAVITRCAQARPHETWIVEEMKEAYIALHKKGSAHSVEVWHHNDLVGGLYGVQVGNIFCGESMFHTEPNASKMAFICLARGLFSRGCAMIDCQLQNPFLESLGVRLIDRLKFESMLSTCADRHMAWPANWSLAPEPDTKFPVEAP